MIFDERRLASTACGYSEPVRIPWRRTPPELADLPQSLPRVNRTRGRRDARRGHPRDLGTRCTLARGTRRRRLPARHAWLALARPSIGWRSTARAVRARQNDPKDGRTPSPADAAARRPSGGAASRRAFGRPDRGGRSWYRSERRVGLSSSAATSCRTSRPRRRRRRSPQRRRSSPQSSGHRRATGAPRDRLAGRGGSTAASGCGRRCLRRPTRRQRLRLRV